MQTNRVLSRDVTYQLKRLIRATIRARAWSNADLARESDTPYSSVSKALRLNANASETVVKLAEFLKIAIPGR